MKTMLSAVVALVFLTAMAVVAFTQELEIHCLNIGHGDCTLIISPTGKTMMVDTGPDIGSSTNHLCGYLDSIGIDFLNYLIITHYDRHNIGGIDTLFKHGVDVDTVYDRGWGYCSDVFEVYSLTVEGIRHRVDEGRVIDLGGDVLAKIVSVNGNGQLAEPFCEKKCTSICTTQVSNVENDFCVAVVIDCNCFEFFVAGDLSGSNDGGYADIETSVAGEVGNLDVYQVNNQGTRYSTNPFFLETIDPEVSILSVGKNSYNHPDTGVVRRLDEKGDIYQTAGADGIDLDGDIVIRTTGQDYFTVNEDLYDCGPNAVFDEREAKSILSFVLHPNYPNPFNATTVIGFTTDARGVALLEVFNILGQRVFLDELDVRSSGWHNFRWDGQDAAGDPVAGGTYFYRVSVNGLTESRKMILLK